MGMDEIKVALGLDGASDAGDVLLAVVDLVQGEACVLAELERVQEAVLAARWAVADVFVEVLEGCGVLDDPEALRAARAMYMVNPDAVAVALLGDVDFVAAARRKDGKRHPDGRLCRAKVRGCPLEKERSELRKDVPPSAIYPTVWEDEIGGGIVVVNPLGVRVVITQGVEADWVGKPQQEVEWRKRNLFYAVETLKNPQEIWQGYKGNKVHVSRFAADEVKKQPERVVIVVTHGNKLVTYYAEKRHLRKMDKYRNGKLLYVRK